MPDQPPTPPPDELGTDPDGHPDVEVYEVAPGVDECAAVEGERFPRRRWAGRRGVLLVDAATVYLLDADDDRKVFVGRARRPLAGDPGDVEYPSVVLDHVVRAAYETEYDVIAAPWSSPAGDPPATAGGA